MQCTFRNYSKRYSPPKQLALDKSLKHAIKEEGNEIKVQVEQAAEGLHERFDETQQLVRELKELVARKLPPRRLKRSRLHYPKRKGGRREE